MRRIGSSPFSFPEFRGATRQLILANLAAFFVLAVSVMIYRDSALAFSTLLALPV